MTATVASEARDRVARVDAALARLETIVDPEARGAALDAIAGLLELYGEGLQRLVAAVAEAAGQDAPAVLEAVADDDLVAHLLLLHDCHPVPVEERIRSALAGVRPYLESHGGGVELLGVEGGVARLRLEGSCNGCGASAATLELAVEGAIREAAPEIERIETEGAVAPPAQPAGFVPLASLTEARGDRPKGPSHGGQDRAAAPAPVQPTGWTAAGPIGGLADGGLGSDVFEVAGQPLLFVRLDDAVYAYRPTCPACGGALVSDPVDDGAIHCDRSNHRFDARRAGRSLDGGSFQADPVPLLVDADGGVRVALAAGT